MPMHCAKTFFALAIALLMGLAAQPASAQRRAGAAARFNPPRSAPRAPNSRGFAGPGQNRNQAGRPGNTFHPPANGNGGQGHPNNAQGNPNAAHPPNAFRPPVTANGGRSQANGAAQPPNGTFQPPNNPNGGAVNSAQNGRQLSNLPPAWGQKLRDMSPQQQERFMQNNERFRNLPPEKQQQIRQNLQKWNNLSPTERMAMKDRQATWERMSPEQKQYVQRTLLPKWQQMSPDRKQVVTDRLHILQGMSAGDRQKALNDPQFMRGLNPDEQSVLRGLDSVRNPSNP
jgi:hypothetical protein